MINIINKLMKSKKSGCKHLNKLNKKNLILKKNTQNCKKNLKNLVKNFLETKIILTMKKNYF